ncbi:MAG: glycoside hydrolase family 25 protein, partial [Clostridium sp.]|nr:glycoside hydrolase family 25 protein [Clostridium sp.]
MKLPDDPNEKSDMNPMFITTIIVVAIIVAVLLMLVLWQNKDTIQNTVPSQPNQITQSNDSTSIVTDPKVNSPDDLGFWDLYPTQTEAEGVTESTDELQPSSKESEDTKTDPATDGKHTRIVHENGDEEWVTINPYLPKQAYDYTKLLSQDGFMKYVENDRTTSYMGIDLSEEQDYIDFAKVKKAGIDFVMIRAGVRGYGTGQLSYDEYFSQNIKRASDANLEVGLYFDSQAITKEEAVEEANLVLDAIDNDTVRYPIAFVVRNPKNDTSRTANLTKSEKTNVAIAFFEVIEKAGYVPMLYGNKEWLIQKLDLTKLTKYDIWLAQTQDLPDYPYEFSMWQYDDG